MAEDEKPNPENVLISWKQWAVARAIEAGSAPDAVVTTAVEYLAFMGFSVTGLPELDRYRAALVEISELPDVEADRAAMIARTAIAGPSEATP